MEESLWINSTKKERKEYDKLKNSINTDICIIGAGLTGLTCAYYLSKQGKNVVVLEKNKIGESTSGNTTAKITSLHGLFYDYLINSEGKQKAKQYIQANEKAIRNIEEIITKENIECDFEKEDSYVFAENINEVEKIKKEVSAVKSLGIDCEFVEKVDINTNNFGAIKFKNQAQFNPSKYVIGLAEAIERNKAIIYENTRVLDVKKEADRYVTITDEGEVISKYVILASHYPILNIPGFYFTKMYQEISYVIAIETKEKLFDGMYINSGEKVLSLRTAREGNKKLVLIGGCTHKTGKGFDLSKNYKVLEEIAKKMYPDAIVKYRWNTQDCISLDKIPYIGQFSNLMENVYVGTGYKKWGMTTSNVAANIITDKILGKENKYEDIFKSTRLEPIKNIEELKNMVKETGESLIVNKLKEPNEYLKDLKKDEGKIIQIDNHKVGAYRDIKGNLFLIKPTCTHLGCELVWNNLDKTWDCPCHGSRFDYKGKNLYNPAIKDLEKLN